MIKKQIKVYFMNLLDLIFVLAGAILMLPGIFGVILILVWIKISPWLGGILGLSRAQKSMEWY
jgi:hypothetical protein